jgi:hypothetical protein
MTLDFKKARELCTEPEFALVVATRTASLRSLAPRLLLLKVARARGLRDKFRDLASRQAREARGKAAPRGRRPARGNARTVEKAQLFGEVLRRFERRAAELDQPVKSGAASRGARATSRAKAATGVKAGAKAPAGPEAPAGPKVPARTRARATRAARPSPQRRARSQAAVGIRKAKKLATSHVPRERSHVSSRNRRGQARRDSR